MSEQPTTPFEPAKQPLYRVIAGLLLAIENCDRRGNAEWKNEHTERLRELVKEHMPSGSGFDSGVDIDFERSNSERLVFYTSFHHMVEGYYDGWTDHTVTVKPSLFYGIDVKVGGRNRNDIKEHIEMWFSDALETMV
jgi:hypothetical protein